MKDPNKPHKRSRERSNLATALALAAGLHAGVLASVNFIKAGTASRARQTISANFNPTEIDIETNQSPKLPQEESAFSLFDKLKSGDPEGEKLLKQKWHNDLQVGRQIPAREFVFLGEKFSPGMNLTDEKIRRANEIIDKKLASLKRLKQYGVSPAILNEIEQLAGNANDEYALHRSSVIRGVLRKDERELRVGNCDYKAFITAIYLGETLPDRQNDISFEQTPASDTQLYPHIRTLFTIKETGLTYAMEPGLPIVTSESIKKNGAKIFKLDDYIKAYTGDAPFPVEYAGGNYTSALQESSTSSSARKFASISSKRHLTKSQLEKIAADEKKEDEAYKKELEQEAQIPNREADPFDRFAHYIDLELLRDLSVESIEKALNANADRNESYPLVNGREPLALGIGHKYFSPQGISIIKQSLKKLQKKGFLQRLIFDHDLSSVSQESINAIFNLLDGDESIFETYHSTLEFNVFQKLPENVLSGIRKFSDQKYTLSLHNQNHKPVKLKEFDKIMKTILRSSPRLNLGNFQIGKEEALIIQQTANEYQSKVKQGEVKNVDLQEIMVFIMDRSSPLLVNKEALKIFQETQNATLYLSLYFDHIQKYPQLALSENVYAHPDYDVQALNLQKQELEISYNNALKAMQNEGVTTPEVLAKMEGIYNKYKTLLGKSS